MPTLRLLCWRLAGLAAAVLAWHAVSPRLMIDDATLRLLCCRLAELVAAMLAHHIGAPDAPGAPPAPYGADAKLDLHAAVSALGQGISPHSTFNVYHR